MTSSSQPYYRVEISSSPTGPQLQFSGFTIEQASELRRLFEERQGASQRPPRPLNQCFPRNHRVLAVHIRGNSFQSFKTHFLAITRVCDKTFQGFAWHPSRACPILRQEQLKDLIEESQLEVEWIERTIPSASLAESSAAQSFVPPLLPLGPNPAAPLPIPFASVPAEGPLPVGQPSFIPFPVAQNFAGPGSLQSSILQYLLAQNNLLIQSLAVQTAQNLATIPLVQNPAAGPQVFSGVPFSVPLMPQLPSIQNPPLGAPLAQSSAVPPLLALSQSSAVPQSAPSALPLARNSEEQYPYLIQMESSTERVSRALIFQGFSPQEEEQIRNTFERAMNPEIRPTSHCGAEQRVVIQLPGGWQQDGCAIAALLEIAEVCSRAFKAFQKSDKSSVMAAHKEVKTIAARHSFVVRVRHNKRASVPNIPVQIRTTPNSSALHISQGFGDEGQRAREGTSRIVSRLEKEMGTFQEHANYFWTRRSMMIEIRGPIQQIVRYLGGDLLACRRNLQSGIQQAQAHGITLVFTERQKQGTKRRQREAALQSPRALLHPDAAAAPSLQDSSNLLIEPPAAPANPQDVPGAAGFSIGSLLPPPEPNQGEEASAPLSFAMMPLLPPLANLPPPADSQGVPRAAGFSIEPLSPLVGPLPSADSQEEWELRLGSREPEQQPQQQEERSFLREDDDESILEFLRNLEK